MTKTKRAASQLTKNNKQKIRTLPLTKIIADRKLYGRMSLNEDMIAEYKDLYRARQKLPPLTVFKIGTSYLLLDGFIRHAALVSAGWKYAQVEILGGSLFTAMRKAYLTNFRHGLRLSDIDYVRSINNVNDETVAEVTEQYRKHPAAKQKKPQSASAFGAHLSFTACPRSGPDGVECASKSPAAL